MRIIGIDKKFLSIKLSIFSYPSVIAYVLGAQKNRLDGMVLWETHNICFGLEIRKLVLTKVLLSTHHSRGKCFLMFFVFLCVCVSYGV